ncbi:DUF441 domain-containing protein [Peribacillus sp. SCS-155]|uniref:DUF441 domain-containing protein n=1 Tax=Peribacillus sedimenti TaxID=3115297 RepID=UPI0039063AC2
MNGAFLFLIMLAIIGFIAKNNSLIAASVTLVLLRITGLDVKVFPYLEAKGINLGVTIITIAVLVPIANGSIGFKELADALKSPYAWIALISGITVALIAKSGLVLLANDPHITVALVFGTIMAVALFRGVAVGPLIGAGIAYLCMQLYSLIK